MALACAFSRIRLPRLAGGLDENEAAEGEAVALPAKPAATGPWARPLHRARSASAADENTSRPRTGWRVAVRSDWILRASPVFVCVLARVRGPTPPGLPSLSFGRAVVAVRLVRNARYRRCVVLAGLAFEWPILAAMPLETLAMRAIRAELPSVLKTGVR